MNSSRIESASVTNNYVNATYHKTKQINKWKLTRQSSHNVETCRCSHDVPVYLRGDSRRKTPSSCCVFCHTKKPLYFSHQHHVMLTDVVLISSCCVFCHTKKPLYFSHQHHIMLTDVVLISSCCCVFCSDLTSVYVNVHGGYPRDSIK